MDDGRLRADLDGTDDLRRPGGHESFKRHRRDRGVRFGQDQLGGAFDEDGRDDGVLPPRREALGRIWSADMPGTAARARPSLDAHPSVRHAALSVRTQSHSEGHGSRRKFLLRAAARHDRADRDSARDAGERTIRPHRRDRASNRTRQHEVRVRDRVHQLGARHAAENGSEPDEPVRRRVCRTGVAGHRLRQHLHRTAHA